MGEVRNRSIRLDDENYDWLTGLPGRSLNEAIERLRTRNEGAVAKTDTMIAEILELVRSLPDPADIEQVVREVVGAKTSESGALGPVAQNLPKNAKCGHCGEWFAGGKYQTICSGCKSNGHTNSPAECPRCTEGTAL